MLRFWNGKRNRISSPNGILLSASGRTKGISPGILGRKRESSVMTQEVVFGKKLRHFLCNGFMLSMKLEAKFLMHSAGKGQGRWKKGLLRLGRTCWFNIIVAANRSAVD